MKVSLSLALLLTTSLAFASGGTGSGGGTGGGGGAPVCGCVELAVSKEIALPGALTQMKIMLTEPKPISTGGGSLSFSAYDSLVGISLASHTQDAYGVAVVTGGNMKLSVISPAATYGSSIDYPILAIVGHVPASAIPGTKIPFNIDPTSLAFFDPNGNPYPTAVKNGFLVVGTSVAIGDVQPGSAVVPPGGVVKIFGTNFFPNTQLRFAEANIQKQFYISPNEIDVVVATTANMHGMMIIAKNPDNTQDTYFSYQRTYPTLPLSTDPVLGISMPLQPPASVTSATVTYPAAGPSTTIGLALSNIGTADANATLELLDATGNTLAFSGMSVAASHYNVQAVSDLFPGVAGGTAVRVTSPVPLEVLGIVANQTTGTAMPVVAK